MKSLISDGLSLKRFTRRALAFLRGFKCRLGASKLASGTQDYGAKNPRRSSALFFPKTSFSLEPSVMNSEQDIGRQQSSHRFHFRECGSEKIPFLHKVSVRRQTSQCQSPNVCLPEEGHYLININSAREVPGSMNDRDRNLRESDLGLHGTFTPNKIESVHRWYPYLEGFSSEFVRRINRRWANRPLGTIYDPFGGTGTALTVAAVEGVKGLYSEINPFMRHVIDCKTNVLRRVAGRSQDFANYADTVLNQASLNETSLVDAEERLTATFPGRPYFRGRRLVELLGLRDALDKVEADGDFTRLGKLALASIGVASSEMKRQADLRYRTESELLSADYSVYDAFAAKARQIADDLDPFYSGLSVTHLAGKNAVETLGHNEEVDFVVTSPPYLNGTNYFRNTKLELWLSGFIEHERELGAFTRDAMIAGINNVTKAGRVSTTYDFVEPIARKLDLVAYDRRIPALVRGYCSDSELWLRNTFTMLKPSARLVVDIGDSRFAGVNVPTDEFLIQIARIVGFHFVESELVRERRSKDGTRLKQVILVFEKPK
jgi:hypothetical protein